MPGGRGFTPQRCRGRRDLDVQVCKVASLKGFTASLPFTRFRLKRRVNLLIVLAFKGRNCIGASLSP